MTIKKNEYVMSSNNYEFYRITRVEQTKDLLLPDNWEVDILYKRKENVYKETPKGFKLKNFYKLVPMELRAESAVEALRKAKSMVKKRSS